MMESTSMARRVKPSEELHCCYTTLGLSGVPASRDLHVRCLYVGVCGRCQAFLHRR
mgnify:CR=1 FL=1